MNNPHFFTLTELQEFLNIDKRQNLRNTLIKRGAPHVTIGREEIFVMDSFVGWLKANEKREGYAEPA